MGLKEELIEMLNSALELEQATRIQYLTHAQQIKGPDAETIIARLEEIAADEAEHERKFRTLIGDYLGGIPSMGTTTPHAGGNDIDILDTDIADEKTAIDFYKQIYRKACDNKDQLPYVFETIEHELRHIIKDEQEHIVELSLLLESRQSPVLA